LCVCKSFFSFYFQSQEPDGCQLTVKTLKTFITQLEDFANSYNFRDRLLVEQTIARSLSLLNYTKKFDNVAEGFKKYAFAMTTEHDKENTSCRNLKESEVELLQHCPHPKQLHDVHIVLLTFADVIKGLKSISTAQYDTCQSILMMCHKCVDSYISEYGKIPGPINKIKQTVGKYREHTGLSGI